MSHELFSLFYPWCVNLIRLFLCDDVLYKLRSLNAGLRFVYMFEQRQDLGQRFCTRVFISNIGTMIAYGLYT